MNLITELSVLQKNQTSDKINKKIFNIISNNITTLLKELNVNHILLLEKIVDIAKKYYFNKVAIITDEKYDLLLNKLIEIDATNKHITSIGFIPIINKIKLPYYLGSISKIVKRYYSNTTVDTTDDNNTINSKFNTWINNFTGPYVISDKLDGISAMLIVFENLSHKLYTRGNGIIGSDISHLLSYINNPIDILMSYLKKNNLYKIICRCELVTKHKISNSRNWVSGKVLSKKLNIDSLNLIDIVTHEIIEPWYSIKDQYKILSSLNILIPNYSIIESININFLSTLLKTRKLSSKYEIDGLIISDGKLFTRVTKNNPKYSIAFKETIETDIQIATVDHVEWNISKDNYIKPRIKIIPISINNISITYVTAHNAKYIYDNKITSGSIIKITRSGNVIPSIIEIISSPSNEAQMPNSIKWIWNKSCVDILAIDNSNEQLIKTLLFFTKKTNIKHVNIATLKIFVNNNIIQSLNDLFSIKKEDLLKLEGFKDKKIDKILNEIKKCINTVDLLTLMTASNIFGRGFGEKKLQKILFIFKNILKISKNILIEELIKNFKEFNKDKAIEFVNNLEEFKNFINLIPFLKIDL